MPSFTATAPGKVILFGEHAVVYGRPAIAVPVVDVKARAIVSADPRGRPGCIQVQAPDIHLESSLEALSPDHPLAKVIQYTLTTLGIAHPPACTVRVTSTIPVAAGLGSGAAVSVALVRALSAFMGHPLPDEEVSHIAYEVEKLHHGTPSGIDNTVITYVRPVYFVRAIPGRSKTANLIETFPIRQPFTLVIGDTGVSSPTSIAVGDVRQAWQTDPARYERLFDAVGTIAEKARQLMESGQSYSLGALMDENHNLLCEMGVSSPELDRLVEAARSSGASGAKLSGAGRGGNMIALADEEKAEAISQALIISGATRTIVTTIKSSRP